MNKVIKQYILYCIFAILSVILNILIQMSVGFVLSNSGLSFLKTTLYKNIDFILLIKMGLATVTVFIFKFIIDKIIIFKDKTKEVDKNITKIFIYGSFAVITTLIFWGSEFLFKTLFKTELFEVIGAILGLSVGYTLKFFLDRKYVFNT